MKESEIAKESLEKALEVIQAMIQRENHAERMTKIASDAAKNYEDYEKKIKEAKEKIASLEAEKQALLADASHQAAEIVSVATETQKMVDSQLAEARKIKEKAIESLVEAENARMAHQAALNEISAQKEKLRAALAV